jgi:hypothetical protein
MELEHESQGGAKRLREEATADGGVTSTDKEDASATTLAKQPAPKKNKPSSQDQDPGGQTVRLLPPLTL